MQDASSAHACFELPSCQAMLRHVQELRARLAARERELRTMRQQRNALLAGLRHSSSKEGTRVNQRGRHQGGSSASLQGNSREDPHGVPQRGRGMRQQRACSEASTDSSRGSSRERSPDGRRVRPARAAAPAAWEAGPPGDQGSSRGEACGAASAGADLGRCTAVQAPDAACSIRMGPPAAAKAPDDIRSEAQPDAWAAPGSPAVPAPHAERAPDPVLWAQTMDAACIALTSPSHCAMRGSLSDCPGSWARVPAALPADAEPGDDPRPSGRAQAGTPAVLPGASGWARMPEPAAWGEPPGSPGLRSASAPSDGGHAEPWGSRAGPEHRPRLARATRCTAAEPDGDALHSSMGDAGDAGLHVAAEGVLRHGEHGEWRGGREREAWAVQEGCGEPLRDPPLLARLANLKLVTDELLLGALL